MLYDIFTRCKALAEAIVEATSRAFLVDGTVSDEDDVYQFLDMTEDDMWNAKGLLYKHPGGLEIRGASCGWVIWPRKDGLSLDKVLDL